MRTQRFRSLLAAAVVVAFGGTVQARHVMHLVTPENIGQQPYAFEVKVKDAKKGEKTEFVEFEIRVRIKAGKKSPGECAHGKIDITQIGEEKLRAPALTMATSTEETRFTFQVPREYVNRTDFIFTESCEDAQHPFPSPGDYWVFKLGKFAKGK